MNNANIPKLRTKYLKQNLESCKSINTDTNQIYNKIYKNNMTNANISQIRNKIFEIYPPIVTNSLIQI